MYTFGLTLCVLIAGFGFLAIGATKLLDGIIVEENEEQDYGRE